MMLRRNSPFWKAGALILAASMLMAGCGGDESSAPESSAPAEVTTDSDGREMVGNVYKEGLPIVKEPVTLTTVISTSVYVTGQVSEMETWKIMEDETNIHIEIQEQIPSTDYTDKVNLMIQGGTVPDIFTNSIGEITSKYYNTGLFTLLDDLIEEWSPSYSKILEDPTIKANIMAVDGHIYATPFYEISLAGCNQRAFRQHRVAGCGGDGNAHDPGRILQRSGGLPGSGPQRQRASGRAAHGAPYEARRQYAPALLRQFRPAY